MQSYMKFYDNIYDVNNKGKRIMDMDKLNEGKLYVLDMHGDLIVFCNLYHHNLFM